jgi:hypothetical protein
MIDIENADIFRKSISESFSALVGNAVRSGWAEHDVALLLMELAEAHLMQVGAGIITEGALLALRAQDSCKN